MRLTKDQIKDMIREEISRMLNETEVQSFIREDDESDDSSDGGDFSPTQADGALSAEPGQYWKTIFGNWRALNRANMDQSFGKDKEAAIDYAASGDPSDAEDYSNMPSF